VGQVEPIFHMLFNILAVSFLAKVDGHLLLFGSIILQIMISKLFDIKLNSIGLQKQPPTKKQIFGFFFAFTNMFVVALFFLFGGVK
jgi:hypothetical protein